MLFCQHNIERPGPKISTSRTTLVKKKVLLEIKTNGKLRHAVSQKIGRANKPTPKYQKIKSLLWDKVSRKRTVQVPIMRKKPETAKRLKSIKIHTTAQRQSKQRQTRRPHKAYTSAQHKKKKTSSNRKAAKSKKQNTTAAAVAFFADNRCLCRVPTDVTRKENKKYRKTP